MSNPRAEAVDILGGGYRVLCSTTFTSGLSASIVTSTRPEGKRGADL